MSAHRFMIAFKGPNFGEFKFLGGLNAFFIFGLSCIQKWVNFKFINGFNCINLIRLTFMCIFLVLE